MQEVNGSTGASDLLLVKKVITFSVEVEINVFSLEKLFTGSGRWSLSVGVKIGGIE